MPDELSASGRKPVGRVDEATIGDFVAEKPPDWVSETLRSYAEANLAVQAVQPQKNTQSTNSAEREVSSANPTAGNSLISNGENATTAGG